MNEVANLIAWLVDSVANRARGSGRTVQNRIVKMYHGSTDRDSQRRITSLFCTGTVRRLRFDVWSPQWHLVWAFRLMMSILLSTGDPREMFLATEVPLCIRCRWLVHLDCSARVPPRPGHGEVFKE